MASRTRNRVLGIAALFGAAAATVLVVLISHGSEGPLVTALRDQTTHYQRKELNDDPRPGTQLLLTPAPSAQPAAQRIARERRHELRPLRGSRRTAKPRVKKHEGIRRARSTNPRLPRGSTLPPPTLAVPAPGPAPSPRSTTPVVAEPAPTEHGGTQPSSLPANPPTPEVRPSEIEIEDGEIESDLDRVRAIDGHVRLHVRSDELVVVDVEDHSSSWSVPAGGEALIEFDATSKKAFKVELRRRKGVLVLRVRD